MAQEEEPFNLALHEHLIGLGYRYVYIPADFTDDGDPENGPMLSGHDAYNAYSDPEEDVYVTREGCVDRETMDPIAKRFADIEEAAQ